MRKSLTSGVAAAALALGMSVAMAQAPQSSPPGSPMPGAGGERAPGQAPGAQERGAQPQGAQGGRSGDAATTGSTGAAATKVDVSSDQRTKLTGVVKKVQIREVATINVPVSVGSVLPSSVELVTVPAEIISIVPTFSSYRAIRVGGRILIVEPDTRRIVFIIDA